MQNNYDSPKSNVDVTYAGFWVRLAAYLIDSVIVFFMLLVVRMAMSGVSSLLYGTVLGGNILFHYTLKDIVLYLGEALYFILCTRYTGTTPGKRAMNLRVISVDESGELDLLTVVYRETVGRFLCGISICIGYLIIGLDREKRGFHDMLCDTRVVYGKKVKVYPVYPYVPAPPTAGAVGAGQGDAAGVPPVRGTMAGTPGSPVEAPPVYPAPSQNGPYRMVQRNEQNARPADQGFFAPQGDIQGNSEIKEEKGDSGEE